MNYINDKCPFCGEILDINDDGTVGYSCNNEKQIIFAKARREVPPPYHSFVYYKRAGDETVISFQFLLKKNKIVRVVLLPRVQKTKVIGRHDAKPFLELDYLLEPDFPDLTKLKYKLNTYINFS